MDRQGFIDFNTKFSPENSRKATSYAQAIMILDEVLAHQNEIDLHGHSLFDIPNAATIEEVLRFVNDEVKKMKNNQQNIFDYGNSGQRSYPLKNFCSAALKSLMEYALYEQEVKVADISCSGIKSKSHLPKTHYSFRSYKRRRRCCRCHKTQKGTGLFSSYDTHQLRQPLCADRHRHSAIAHCQPHHPLGRQETQARSPESLQRYLSLGTL